MENKQAIPSILQSLSFRGKASLFRLKRTGQNMLDFSLKKHTVRDSLKDKTVIAESKTKLWTDSTPEERFLTAGKIHNLRLAVEKLNNLEIPAGAVFSFWKHTGKASRFNGYVVGRELREGCLIPNVGGGLCQLSNALYDAALQAKFEIIERHAHTQIVSGSLAEQGRDATVFWNYVDLRFKSPASFRIEIKLESENLVVRFKSDLAQNKILHQINRSKSSNPSVKSSNNCVTCGIDDCFRSVKALQTLDFGQTAFLVDEYSPEFDEFIQKHKKGGDSLLIPLDGKRFKKANYAWSCDDFSKIKQSLFVTAFRAYKSRKLAAQGASRQKNLLEMSERLAHSYAKNLTYDVLHVVVHQNLLPFLWRKGVLGGRTFDVLMNGLPLKHLQKRLDYAKSIHSESKTLNDFRAPVWLIEAETEALKNAGKIITPHTEIASLFSDKAVLLDWQLPKTKDLKHRDNDRPTIILPASTVGRKGVYELREAMRGLDVRLITLGANIEDRDFWKGFEVEFGDPQNGWLEKADLVVLPAFVEHKPRRILEAVAYHIPVIVSKACGLENVENVETVATGNVEDLRLGLQKILARL